MKIRWVVVAGLVVIGTGVWWTSSVARDEQACRAECAAEREACIETCSAHANPVECEGGCRDAEAECMRACR